MQEATADYRRIFEARGEAPIIAGRTTVVLAADSAILRRTGRRLIAAEVARRAELREEVGRRPESPRSVRRIV